MMEPEPLIAFLGIHLQPGKPVSSAQYLTDGSGVESTVCLHFTQATLGDKPKAGRTTIWVTHGKEKFALGTLETGRVELFSLDLMFVSELSFTTSGVNDVYLTGYKTLTPTQDDDMGPNLIDDEDEDDEDDDEDESDDEEEAPALVAAKGAAGLPKANGLVVNNFPAMNGMAMEDDDDEDDSEDDDEDDDAEDDDDDDDDAAPMLDPAQLAKLQALAKSAASAAAPGGLLVDDEADEDDDDEDDDDDSDLMEDDEDEDEDDDDEELGPAAMAAEIEQMRKTQPQQSGKRPAVAPAALATAGKKQKGAAGIPVQAAAPAAAAKPAKGKAAAPAAAGGDAAALQSYVKSIKEYITKNGSTKLSELGSKVKKPAGLTTKLTKAINESGAFSMSKTQEVSLK